MTLREIMVGYPASKDITLHPYYQGKASQWVWRFYHFRFTRVGRWFLGITTLIFLVIALFWNLGSQILTLAIFTIGFWLASAVAFLPVPVRAQAQHGERLLAGENLTIEVKLTHTGRLPLTDLTLQAWGLPTELDALPEEGVPIGTLRQGESRSLRLTLVCRKRGTFTLKGYRVLTDYPLGLLNAYHVIPHATRLIVHPAFTPLRHVELPQGRRYQPGGIAMASQVGDSFEYLGNRAWREGDNPRDIDWRSTARLAGALTAPLVVREWREEYFLRVGVVLDTHVPESFSHSQAQRLFSRELGERLRPQALQARQQRLETLERAVSVCAAVSDALARRDYIVDLFAAGPDLYHLMAGRSLAYREQILDLLACVEPSPEEPLSQIAPKLVEELSRLTTVICVVLDWDTPRQHFVENLRAQGVGVKVIWVSETETAQAADPTVRVLTPSILQNGGVQEL